MGRFRGDSPLIEDWKTNLGMGFLLAVLRALLTQAAFLVQIAEGGERLVVIGAHLNDG